MIKKVFLLFVFISLKTSAQQDPQFTQYMYNMSIVNPAYATSDFNSVNVGLLYRKQWVDFENAPVTSTFFAHTPINDKNEIGVSFYYDKINYYNEKKLALDYSYIVNIDQYNKLSFGVKLGLNNFNTDFSNIALESGNNTTDKVFENNESRFYPNLGAGLFYYAKNRYFGISIPNFLKSKYVDIKSSTASEEIHYYAMGGYVFNVGQTFKLKPSFILNSSLNGKPNLDLCLNGLINNKFELGSSYRLNNSVNFLANIYVLKNLRIGYSYDLPINSLRSTKGTHEIFLLFDILKNSQINKSPRFF